MTRLRWTLLGWFLVGPLFLIGCVPRWLYSLQSADPIWRNSWQDWLGAWFIFNGACLAGWCVRLFEKVGQGTPMPVKPPTEFVRTGPYRFVRNPMAIGMFLILAGEGLLYGSTAVWAYAIFLTAAVLAFVYCVEEPDLDRRFGPIYHAYRQQVPRWIPRLILLGAASRKKR